MRSKLRHPIRAIREPFGTAGLIVACIALIAALGGSAIAAGKLTSKQKKEVEKIAKKYAGKPGAPGAAGPAGPQGAAGSNGKDGTSGTNGTSPAGTQFSGAKGGCTEGGVEFKGANTSYACNGVKGANGQTGFTATLPPGQTETGVWSDSADIDGSGGFMPLSFNIPLAKAIPVANLHLLEVGEDKTAECPGTVADPKAIAGHFCLYTELAEGFTFNSAFFPALKNLSLVSGVNVPVGLKENGLAYGSWAVTAPTS